MLFGSIVELLDSPKGYFSLETFIFVLVLGLGKDSLEIEGFELADVDVGDEVVGLPLPIEFLYVVSVPVHHGDLLRRQELVVNHVIFLCQGRLLGLVQTFPVEIIILQPLRLELEFLKI